MRDVVLTILPRWAERITAPLADFRYWKAPRSWCYIEDVEICDRWQW